MMKTLGVYLLAVLVAAMFYCRCADKMEAWLDGMSALPSQNDQGLLACNDEAVLESLKNALSEKYEGIFDVARDFIVEWERKSDDHVICRARSVYKAPIARQKQMGSDTAGLLDAVNEVFGLKRKKGDTMWVDYEAYRTLRDKENGGYVFVDLIGRATVSSR